MFEFDVTKLLVVAVVALVVIGPKDLPATLRKLGRFVSAMRRMTDHYRAQLNEAIRDTELGSIRTELQNASSELHAAIHEIPKSEAMQPDTTKPDPAHEAPQTKETA